MTSSSTAGFPALEGTGWQLVSATGRSGDPFDVDGAGATFAINQGRLALNTGCNTGGGTVVVNDATIDIGGVFTTRMACEENRMALERTVLAVLTGSVDYSVAGDRLTITGAGGKLVYQAGPPTDSSTADSSDAPTSGVASAEPAPTVGPTSVEPGTPATEKSVNRTSIPTQPEN